MKYSIKYVLKVAIIIAIIVFLIERIAFSKTIVMPLADFAFIFGIHLMYSVVLTAINFFFFYYIEKKYNWKDNSKLRLVVGAVGSISLTMIGLAVLRFIVLVPIQGRNVSYFLDDPNAGQYYLFGLIITLIASLVFHAIYFYKALTEKRVKEQKIVAKTETAKFESLKSQIDPHFLFNSLNVLTSLIGENPIQAEKFTTKLSKVYRYVLEQKNKDLISLDEELQFARAYMELLKMRFENAVTFEIPESSSNPEYKIIPLSLQLLLENTIKHNVVSEESPLEVVIKEVGGYLIVENNFNPKSILEKGTKVGLKNIIDRYNLITLRKVSIEKNQGAFTVRLPLLTQKTKKMKTSSDQSHKYLRAVERVNEIKEFYGSLISFCVIMPFLIYINFKFSPSFHWFWFAAFGWGIGLIIHAVKAFGYNPFLSKDWEDKKIREYMKNDENQFWE